MNLISIETPTARVATTGKTPELLDTAVGIVAARKLLQVVADQLIQAFAERVGFLPRAGDKLRIDGQGDIDDHSICAHVSRVERRTDAVLPWCMEALGPSISLL